MRDREVISSAMGDVCPRCGSLDVRLSLKGAGKGATGSTWFATCSKCWHEWSPNEKVVDSRATTMRSRPSDLANGAGPGSLAD
jgi:hypothetical protein